MTDQPNPNPNPNSATAPLQDPAPAEDLAKKDAEALKALADDDQRIKDATGQGEPDNTRPDWLPDKFKTAEDMAKSYAELEKKLGGLKAEPKADPPADDKKDDAPAEQNIVDKYTAKYMESGELSADDYAELKKAGYDKQIVDGYIEGKKAQQAAYETEVLKVVDGDRDIYKKMTDWGVENYTEKELAVFNNMVTSGDITQASMAIENLKNRYNTGNPADPTNVTGQGGSPAGAFQSWAEVTRAMSDPKYKTDTAYRNQVQAKLNASGSLA